MGLGNFRWRLLLIIIIVLLLWHSSKVWSIFGQTDLTVKVQASENQALTTLFKDENKEKIQQVLVGVYYETLCPDSRNFLLKQLLPTYNKIKENMQVEFIPYGKAKTVQTDHGYEFTCQHGPLECQGNIIHACSIDIIDDPSILLNYLSCMIKNNVAPVHIMESCAQKLNVDSNAILKCFQGSRGRELVAKYGEMTNSLKPPITFIPTITLDGSSEGLPKILRNLLHEICLRLQIVPEGCKT